LSSTLETITDSFGNEVRIGDFVAWGAGGKYNAGLRLGQLAKIRECDAGVWRISVDLYYDGERARRGTDTNQQLVKYPVEYLDTDTALAALRYDPARFPIEYTALDYCVAQFRGCSELSGRGVNELDAHTALLKAWHAVDKLGGSLTFNGRPCVSG
jgi:hypothetical protein